MSERWVIKCLGDITTKIGSGSTPRGGDAVYQTEGVPLIRSMNVHFSGFKYDGLVYLDTVQAKKLANVVVQPYDVLLNITGASVGRVTIAPTELGGARVNQHVCIIRPTAELDPRFLAYYLSTPREQARVMNVQVGATRQALTKAMVENWRVPVPPLEHQHKIVAVIDEQLSRLDAGVAALRRAQANLKRYRAAVLKAACEGRLVPTDARGPKPRAEVEAIERDFSGNSPAAQESQDGANNPGLLNREINYSLPQGWDWRSVRELATLVQYGSSAKTGPDETGVPVLRMGNLQTGKLLLTSLKYLPLNHGEFPGLILEPGDLLFNRTNSPELVGKAAIYRGIPEICSFASYLIRVRVSPYCLPDYLLYFINSVFGRDWVGRVVTQQVGQANVNGTKLQALKVPVPPYAEQVQIVAEVERRLSVVDELEATVAADSRRATRLRQAILQRAFSGVTAAK